MERKEERRRGREEERKRGREEERKRGGEEERRRGEEERRRGGEEERSGGAEERRREERGESVEGRGERGEKAIYLILVHTIVFERTRYDDEGW